MDLRKLSKVVDSCIKDATKSNKPVIKIPTNQELIDHFRKLGEEIKENPNWKRLKGIKNPFISLHSTLGEWETYIHIQENILRSDEYDISLHVAPPKEHYHPKRDKGGTIWAAGGDTATPEQLERNWESILEEAAEDIIRQLNDNIHRLKRYFNVVDSYKVMRNSNQRISDSESEPDYTNEVIYKLESEGNGYTLEVDDNVLYLYTDSDQPRGQMWIDKFGEIHIEDFANDEPLTADERTILEKAARKAKGKYYNEYTGANISLWAIEHKFTTPHKIENNDGVWAITFDGDPTDAEIKLMKRHKIKFDEDYGEWA